LIVECQNRIRYIEPRLCAEPASVITFDRKKLKFMLVKFVIREANAEVLDYGSVHIQAILCKPEINLIKCGY